MPHGDDEIELALISSRSSSDCQLSTDLCGPKHGHKFNAGHVDGIGSNRNDENTATLRNRIVRSLFFQECLFVHCFAGVLRYTTDNRIEPNRYPNSSNRNAYVRRTVCFDEAVVPRVIRWVSKCLLSLTGRTASQRASEGLIVPNVVSEIFDIPSTGRDHDSAGFALEYTLK